MKNLISIIAPMYNEEKLVHEYCREMLVMTHSLSHKYDFEIILVNDGSQDNTYTLMLQEHQSAPQQISVICLSRNFGLEGAVNAGLKKTIGDAVIVMDADLQDPPSLIPEMIQKWEAGADIVVASRVKRSNDNFFKKVSSACYYKILDCLSGKLKLEKSAANFRLISRKALNQILDLPEVNGVFRVLVPFVGMQTDIVEYDRDKRFAGKTKYKIKSMIPYALDSITGISVEPLRKIWFCVPLSILLFIISCIGIFWGQALWKLISLILLVVSLFFGVLFFAISIMAEYIAQIMIEIKGRPISIVYDYIPCMNTERRMKQ